MIMLYFFIINFYIEIFKLLFLNDIFKIYELVNFFLFKYL